MKASGQNDGATKQEVNNFLIMLNEYGLRLDDLVKNTPRSWQDREKAKRIARSLGNDPQLMAYIKEHRSPPPTSSQETHNWDPRLMGKYFLFITGVALIISGRFPILTELVSTWAGGDI